MEISSLKVMKLMGVLELVGQSCKEDSERLVVIEGLRYI